MLARRIAAATTAAALAAPAAAHAAPVVRHASEGPSATPLLVELAAAALIGLLAITRKPLGRRLRALRDTLAKRRAARHLPRAAGAANR